MRAFIIIVIISFLCNPIIGQELPISFQRYYSKDGLSSNTILCIFRDSQGFLWLGTEDGLNRYDGKNYKVYRYDADNKEGLKSNHITALFEDREGRIWIGTNGGGLSYYDRKMDIIRSYDRTPDNRPLNAAITCIEQDHNGNLWVGSYGALYVLNTKNLNKVPDNSYLKIVDSFLGKISRFIYKDSKDRMWVASGENVYMFSKDFKKKKHYKLLDTNFDKSNHSEVTSIIEDDQNRIWISTSYGLKYLSPDQKDFLPLNKFGSGRISSNRIYSIAKDLKGGLWVGTDKGLDILNTLNFDVTSFTPDVANMHSLSHKSIRSIFVDRYGIYWVGTFQGGLNKYDTNLSHFKLKGVDFFASKDNSFNMITSFTEYEDKVLLGVDVGGVFVYDRKNDKVSPLSFDSELGNGLSVLSLEKKQDDLFIGTYQKGLYKYNLKTQKLYHYPHDETETGLNNKDIFCLKKDFLGNIWIGTNGGGINLISAQDGSLKKYLFKDRQVLNDIEPAGDFIRVITEDEQNNMWVGTYGSGLSVYNPITRKNIFYDKENSGLPSNYVLAIHVDKQGNAWVGTNGNGIGLLRKGTSRFEIISEKHGLINGVVQSIVEANNGNIWFSTNKGLSCYNPSEKKFKNYTQSAGLQDGAFMQGAGLKLNDGEIYFGGQNGFNHFYPKDLKLNNNPARVVLTELRIDNELIKPEVDGILKESLLTADQIELKYKQNFSISFEALNFTVPEDNQFEYRLLGLDNNWITGGKENSAYFTNLDPGEYTFQVRARNNDGIWNEEVKSITIIVAPPFWLTIYAYIFYVLLFVGAILLLRHRGIKKLEHKFALEQERIQARQLIEQQKREAEALHQLDQMKIKFLTNLSHEFRTPISLIIGPIDNLISKNQDPNVSESLNLIKRNIRRLLNLVNQLLDFRKMEEHELKLHNTNGNIISFIEEVFQSFADMAVKKGIEYSFNTCEKRFYTAFDEDKIERILFNIISNAFKFTEKGGDIAVNIIGLKLEENNKKRITIEVRDTGIGIPEYAQKSIFESFFQHETVGRVLNQGSGIGLSIAESFVKMYNGKISVDSEVDKGSVFTFNLLLEIIEEPVEDLLLENELADHNIITIPVQKSVVLIIEDDDDFRTYLRDCLIETYQVIESVNGKEGWQKALFHHPDIIISDVHMPIMNGLELAQKLASDKRTKQIPIILLTASQVENGLVCGFESGAVGYINKPFDVNVLLAKLNSLLALNFAFKDVYSRQLTINTPEIEIVSEKDRFIQNVSTYIHDNINNPQLSVEMLSIHLSISRASLYNRILDYTGMSPVEFIRSIKLEMAANLLKKSDKTIAEIAYETGFANPNYFTKVFKSKYQMKPSDYILSFKNTK